MRLVPLSTFSRSLEGFLPRECRFRVPMLESILFPHLGVFAVLTQRNLGGVMKRTSLFAIVLAALLACLFMPLAAQAQGLASLYYSLPNGTNPSQNSYAQLSALQDSLATMTPTTTLVTPYLALS